MNKLTKALSVRETLSLATPKSNITIANPRKPWMKIGTIEWHNDTTGKVLIRWHNGNEDVPINRRQASIHFLEEVRMVE